MPYKRKLNDTLTIVRSQKYPYKYHGEIKYRYLATIGIGGNIQDVYRRFNHLFFRLQKDIGVQVLQSGLILKNPPFGYTKQNDFYNSAMIIATSMQPKKLLSYLMRVEKSFGRKRSFQNAPRTLDLDILFFDNRYINTPKLHVPHPHWHERPSVLIPLMSLYR
jgi:2-amino-4-hydroxy-6-hydroxymethyldihydropteridine diphosphokinase